MKTSSQPRFGFILLHVLGQTPKLLCRTQQGCKPKNHLDILMRLQSNQEFARTIKPFGCPRAAISKNPALMRIPTLTENLKPVLASHSSCQLSSSLCVDLTFREAIPLNLTVLSKWQYCFGLCLSVIPWPSAKLTCWAQMSKIKKIGQDNKTDLRRKAFLKEPLPSLKPIHEKMNIVKV